MDKTPSTNGSNGRAGNGQFARGNGGGPGNPHAKRVAELRAAMLAAVSVDDLTAVAAKLVAMAKGGDLAAIRELLDRTFGKAVQIAESQDGGSGATIVVNLADADREHLHEWERLGLPNGDGSPRVVVNLGEADKEHLEESRRMKAERCRRLGMAANSDSEQ